MAKLEYGPEIQYCPEYDWEGQPNNFRNNKICPKCGHKSGLRVKQIHCTEER